MPVQLALIHLDAVPFFGCPQLRHLIVVGVVYLRFFELSFSTARVAHASLGHLLAVPFLFVPHVLHVTLVALAYFRFRSKSSLHLALVHLLPVSFFGLEHLRHFMIPLFVLAFAPVPTVPTFAPAFAALNAAARDFAMGVPPSWAGPWERLALCIISPAISETIRAEAVVAAGAEAKAVAVEEAEARTAPAFWLVIVIGPLLLLLLREIMLLLLPFLGCDTNDCWYCCCCSRCALLMQASAKACCAAGRDGHRCRLLLCSRVQIRGYCNI
jgi:hypothetical protein